MNASGLATRGRRRLIAIPFAAALAAGCGSTVAMTGTAADQSSGLSVAGSQSGVNSGGLTSTAGAPGSSALPNGRIPASPGAGADGGTPLQSASGSGLRSGSVTGSTRGRGFDAKTIRIGFNTLNNVSTFFKAAGAGDVSWGDMKADADAIMADINAHGGVLGRKLVGVFHDEDVAQATTNPSTNAETTCQALTQDVTVVAAAINDTAGDDNDTFYACMKKADTPFFTAIDSMIDKAWVNQYLGYLHSMQGPTFDVFAPVFLRRLAALGYFSPWDTTAGAPGTAPVKIGMMFPDNGVGHRSASLTSRLLAARGTSYAPPVFYASTPSDAAAQVQNAVLKFRSAGVTHVFMLEAVTNYFMTVAEQQRYRPRYAYSSLWQFTQGGGTGGAPVGQFTGAVGSGWEPYVDTGDNTNPAAKACMAALKRGGVDYGGSLVPTDIALYLCDEIRLIAQAIEAGGGFSTADLNAGLARIGHTYTPAVVSFQTGFSSTRADVVGAVRDIAFNTECGCFRYRSSQLWSV